MRWTRKVTEESRQHPLISLRADCLYPTTAKADKVPKRKHANDSDPETTKKPASSGLFACNIHEIFIQKVVKAQSAKQTNPFNVFVFDQKSLYESERKLSDYFNFKTTKKLVDMMKTSDIVLKQYQIAKAKGFSMKDKSIDISYFDPAVFSR